MHHIVASLRIGKSFMPILLFIGNPEMTPIYFNALLPVYERASPRTGWQLAASFGSLEQLSLFLLLLLLDTPLLVDNATAAQLVE